MPDSDSSDSAGVPDDPSGLDDLDEFELAALSREPSPRRLPSWFVNPVQDVTLLPHDCELMTAFLGEADLQLSYDDQFREYSISYAEAAGPSVVLIYHCPFCGERLPDSVREQWFERVWALDLEPEDPQVPAELRSGRWWRDAGL